MYAYNNISHKPPTTGIVELEITQNLSKSRV